MNGNNNILSYICIYKCMLHIREYPPWAWAISSEEELS